MFVFIGFSLLLSVGGNTADTGASMVTRTLCQGEFCINLSEGEIRAEAGLCAVILCSFTTGARFTPDSTAWFKCDPSKARCDASGVNILSRVIGRVSLLEPDINKRNCSIIINDLIASDSGSYQLRVNGFTLFLDDRYTFSPRATLTVEDLTQKPTVMVPPLTEGQQATLSCTAPGLCSGSAPEITWMWRGGGGGGGDTFIRGNITDFTIEHLSRVSQRHTSTLTFNPSFAIHHSTEVTCRVSFKNVSTAETVTLEVNTHPKILHSSKCRVHSEVLTCVCTSQGFPSPTIKWSLLANHTEAFVTTSMANHTVNSTLTMTVNNDSNMAAECVSSNIVGEVKKSLTMIISEGADHLWKKALLPWTVAALSLTLNVILVISVMLLWKKRKTVKSNQEDRTYMSLQKADRSPEYDVIRQTRN